MTDQNRTPEHRAPEDRAPEDRAPEDRAPEDRAPEDRSAAESVAEAGPGPVSGTASGATAAAGTTEAAETPAAGPEAAPATADQVAELRDRWLRAVAELDNFRKRAARDMARQREDERARVAAEWLPVVDNLDLALRHAAGDTGAVIEGVRAVRDQAVAVLARLGFPRREDLGARFDPARHEAVSTAEVTDAEPGTVVAVVRPGYGDGARQLRPASVVVATRTED